ncbi:uncharacterized protein [Onthophagus taurus]|uniref:uncharacterized protein isoform X2 n=1 Tax=Onthophagus taurus TaxID=166361 RepID=UPI0039BE9C4A
MESFVMSGHGNDLKLKRFRTAATNLFKKTKGRQQQSGNRNNSVNNNCSATSSNKHNRIHHHQNKNYYRNNYSSTSNNNNNNNNSASSSSSSSTTLSSSTSQCSSTTSNNNGFWDNFIIGTFTREIYNAISGRLGNTQYITEENVLPFFHDIDLFPSKQLDCTNNCEVFLGGSCNPTTWRVDTAIPELQKHGISYYNPQVPMWAPELVAAEHNAKESASVLLYVVDSQTRSVSGMIEVAYLVASGRCVVLVAYPYSLGQTIMGEIITKRECFDLVSGQTTLLTLVKSHGIKVHDNLKSAIQCTTRILRNPSMNRLTAEEQITFKLRKLRETFDRYDKDQTGEISLIDVVDAYTKLTNHNIEPIRVHNYLNYNRKSPAEDANSTAGFTFQHFCALVAEFSVDGCDDFNNAWVSQPLQSSRYQPDNSLITNRNVITNPREIHDIFLGGSCHTSSRRWRLQAEHLISKHGLSYYNPTTCSTSLSNYQNFTNGNVLRSTSLYFVSNNSFYDDEPLDDSTVLQWRKAIDRSRVLLFVVSNETRCLTTMIMAAYYIGLNRKVVLCVQHLGEDDIEVGNEKLSKQAVKDYNRGRVYLTDLAKRKQVPVFENVTMAVQCAVDECQRSR